VVLGAIERNCVGLSIGACGFEAQEARVGETDMRGGKVRIRFESGGEAACGGIDRIDGQCFERRAAVHEGAVGLVRLGDRYPCDRLRAARDVFDAPVNM
jgi:hypothetical protein